MTVKRTLKLTHFTGTLFFAVSIAFILILALRQREVSWWVIFSLSGHTIVVGLILLSVYLFAMFRGVGGSEIPAEHPLTSSGYYMLLYVSSPYLGLFAGLFAMIGTSDITRFFLGVSLGTFGGTFIGWVVIDPLAGVIESLLPSSRRHRAERFAAVKAQKQQKEAARQRVLKEVLAAEETSRSNWEKELAGRAEELALLVEKQRSDEEASVIAATIGVEAWRLGGLSCMKFLHRTALDICRKRAEGRGGEVVDRISAWWDGIGRWQNTSIA